MSKVHSADGTEIAFERIGAGSPLILVVGAFNDRSTGLPLAEALAPQFTVFAYDRRGRGDSGDTATYAVQREIEDLAALVHEAGGSASVFGYSSGANLALLAAAHRLPITRLALYDAPYIVDVEQAKAQPDHAAHLAELIGAGQRGDAVETFQTRLVGIPEEMVVQMRHAPFRPALEAIAHTLVYEAIVTGDRSLPTELADAVRMPTLVIAGGNSPFMRAAAQALADLLPDARADILEGQGHDIVPAVLGPVLTAFLKGGNHHDQDLEAEAKDQTEWDARA
jgi:pimeloyl-ACP methyl ester carboxylesterase